MLHLNKISTPIFALTADMTLEKLPEFKESMFDGVLYKPFNLFDIIALLKKHKFQASHKKIVPVASNRIAKTLGIDEEHLHKLYENYTKNLDKKLPELALALSQNNFKVIKKIAHQIKGSASSLLQEEAYKACIAIENAVEKEQFESLKEAYETLKKVHERFKTPAP